MSGDLSACTRCQFCFNGNGPVLPSGPTPNPIMVLSSHPTFDDDRAGRYAHKGDPSFLLRQLLDRNGLDLDGLFFTSVISCWPSSLPLDRALRACQPNVRSLIAECDPQLVLVLGSVALSTISPRHRIERHHGQPFTALAGPFIGREVFPVHHPASLKHTPANVTMLSADIAAFAERAKGLPWKTSTTSTNQPKRTSTASTSSPTPLGHSTTTAPTSMTGHET